MAESILVVAEQREGKLNRVSFETVAAAQQIAKHMGSIVEVVLPGSNVSALAQELAAKAVARVYALEAASLAAYTSDSYVFALKSFVEQKQPKLVLFPHTYQVRDFAPRLALTLDRTLISDAVGYKHEGGKLLFTRPEVQMSELVTNLLILARAEAEGCAALASFDKGLKKRFPQFVIVPK